MFNTDEHDAMQIEATESQAQAGIVYRTLAAETRTHVETAAAAHYLNRRPQTLRGWACFETYPEGLRPIRINGRLAWPVAGIRAVLGV